MAQLAQVTRQAKFQHTAARRRLLFFGTRLFWKHQFQHTAARRRLPEWLEEQNHSAYVSTHSRTEAAAKVKPHFELRSIVSTHSRTEAAAPYIKK